MGDDLLKGILAIVAGVISLATLSVILSKSAQTPAVLGAASSGLANIVGAAVAPVTGAKSTIQTSSGAGSNLGASTFSNGLGGIADSINSVSDIGSALSGLVNV